MLLLAEPHPRLSLRAGDSKGEGTDGVSDLDDSRTEGLSPRPRRRVRVVWSFPGLRLSPNLGMGTATSLGFNLGLCLLDRRSEPLSSAYYIFLGLQSRAEMMNMLVDDMQILRTRHRKCVGHGLCMSSSTW